MTIDASYIRLSALSQQQLRRRAAMISFAVGLLMFAIKSGAYLLTNSTAILSDAMESVVHVLATGIALYTVILAGRPADERYPYGYGKAEYFSAGVEGVLILAAAAAICYQATRDIIVGNTLRQLDIGVMVLAAAGAVNLVLGLYLMRVGRQTNSLALLADGKHVLTDSYTSIGVLVGIILVRFTGITILDPLFAILVALNIIVTGYQLVGESVRGLMNASDPETLERALWVVNQRRTPEMIDLHGMRAWRAGEQRFIDFHLTLPHYMDLDGAGAVRERLHQALGNEFGGRAEILIHLDPCTPVRCRSCPNAACPAHPRLQPMESGQEMEPA